MNHDNLIETNGRFAGRTPTVTAAPKSAPVPHDGPMIHLEDRTELSLRGVEVRIQVNGVLYTPGQKIGIIKPGTTVAIMVMVKKDSPHHISVGYTHRDEKEEDSIRSLSIVHDDGNVVIYKHEFKMSGQGPKGFAAWPHNRIYVLVGDTTGKYMMYLPGVFTQNWQNFAWVQRMEFDLIKRRVQDNELLIGRFAASTMWSLFINEVLKHVTLPQTYDEVVPFERVVPDIDDFREDEGVVQYFNVYENGGYAWVRYGDRMVSAKVHLKNIEFPADESGLKLLRAGDTVHGKLDVGTFQSGIQAGTERFELFEIELSPITNP